MSTRKIYKLINLINNKIYIGKTIKSLETRFHEHITTAKRWKIEELAGKPHPYQSRLYPSMNKYGYNNFKIELIEELSEQSSDTLEQREQYWISYYNTTNTNIGYNISPGGLGGPLFKGHTQSDYCRQSNSKRFKGKSQPAELIHKRSIGRARLMQSLDTGESISILNLPKGYFYKQNLTSYRIYKTNNKFYACLESPHNRLPELSTQSRQELLTLLLELTTLRHTAQITALHNGNKNRTIDSKINSAKKISASKQITQKIQIEKFLSEHNINPEEYKQIYLKYKDVCPNKHLELIYKISYSKVRALNKYLGLAGGGSGHKGGKVTVETNN